MIVKSGEKDKSESYLIVSVYIIYTRFWRRAVTIMPYRGRHRNYNLYIGVYGKCYDFVLKFTSRD